MKKTINLIKFIMALLLLFNIGNILLIIFHLLNIDVSTFNFNDIAYSEILTSLILFIILFFVYKDKLLNDWHNFKINLKNNLIKCFKLFMIMLVVKILSSLVVYVISTCLGISVTTSENQSIIYLLIKDAPMMMLISSIILAPFIEETIFRLGLKTIIKNKLLFVLISGVVFGFMHIFPTDISTTVALIQSIGYISLGTLFAYYYVNYENIYFVIILHSLNNLLGVLAALLLI